MTHPQSPNSTPQNRNTEITATHHIIQSLLSKLHRYTCMIMPAAIRLYEGHIPCTVLTPSSEQITIAPELIIGLCGLPVVQKQYNYILQPQMFQKHPGMLQCNTFSIQWNWVELFTTLLLTNILMNLSKYSTFRRDCNRYIIHFNRGSLLTTSAVNWSNATA